MRYIEALLCAFFDFFQCQKYAPDEEILRQGRIETVRGIYSYST